MTNALRHGAGRIEVRVLLGAPLRVEVRDESREPPVLRPSAPGVEGGRGLFLVHALAAAAGWERVGDGKKVWFEL